MIRRFLSHNLSYANIVATLALVLAVTGGAYAATQLPKNSVGSKQVKDSSLKAKDFKSGQLPAGAPGPVGPQGPQGASGPKGDTGEPGPSLLLADRKAWPQQVLAMACEGKVLTTEPFSVSQASRLWASGAGTYVASTADGGSYFAHLSVFLYQDDNEVFDPGDPVVAGTDEASLTGINQAHLNSNGWLNVADGPATLQPGTHYRLALTFIVNGAPSCGFAAQLNKPTLNWAAFPMAG